MPACWRRRCISGSIRAAMSGPTIPCSRRSGESFQRLAEVALEADAIGIDGCSVPTFALPLAAVATGFARLASGRGLERRAGRGGAAAHGGLLCRAGPRGRRGPLRHHRHARARAGTAFAKGGAEGVHCAALPALGIGIAVKVDDGTKRGAEMVLAVLLAKLVAEARTGPCQSARRRDAHLAWREGGRGRPAPALKAAVRALPRQSAAATAAAPR